MFTTTASSDSCSIFDCPSIGRRLTAGDSTKWRCCNIGVAPNCPRCASTNTKFCYYNNYSLSQPRYFCKACRRYWTKGGSLRNVPVGGGCRKSRRARSARTGPNLIPAPAPRPDSVPCIDLAAVFAKYVRRSAEGDEPSFSPGPSSGSSGNYSQIEDGTIFDYHRKVVPMDDLIDLGDNDRVRCGAPDQFLARQEMDGADFACQGIGPIGGQQSPIGDDVATGVLWSSDGTLLPDFGPEGMAVPELGLFSGDDQIGVSSNLPTENWGLFDLSAYETFSNP